MNIEQLLLNQISLVTDKRCEFFTQKDIMKLENSNVLKEHEVTIVSNFEQLQNYLYGDDFSWYKRLNDDCSIGIDIETMGFNPKKDPIVGIGLSDGNNHLYIQLPLSYEYRYYNEIKEYLKHIFKKCNRLVAHNLKFEFKFIFEQFGLMMPENKCIDTMVYAYLLSEESLKLSKLAEKHLNRYPLSWDTLCLKHNTTNAYELPLTEIARYCCEDALETLDLSYKLGKELYKTCNVNIINIDLLNSPVLAFIENLGVKVNKSKIDEVLAYCESVRDDLMDCFYNIGCNFSVNVNSPIQLSKFLYEDLHISIEGVKKGKNGYYSCDKTTLTELSGEHEIVDVLIDLSVINKAISFLKGKKAKGLINIIDENGFIYPNVNNCLTATGRFSMSNPNLQQQPNPAKYASLGNKNLATVGKMIRSLYIPRSQDKLFVIADYPSFEFRILETLSNDKTLFDVFNENRDFHIEVCQKLFQIEYDKNNKQHKLYRQVTKTINYGCAYGMSWIRLKRECLKVGLDYSQKECEKILSDYWSVLNGVYVFFCREKLKALIHGYSETLWGRKRYYNFSYNWKLINFIQDNFSYVDVYNDSSEFILYVWNELEKQNLFTSYCNKQFRTIQNNPLQGTNADVVRKVLNELYFTFKNNPEWQALTVLNVHDEFVNEVNVNYVEQAKNTIKKLMEDSIKLNIPLVIDPIVCKTWGDAK